MRNRVPFAVAFILQSVICNLLSAIPLPDLAPVEWRPSLRAAGPPLAESTHAFDVRHYRIDLDLGMTSGAAQAHTRIEFISRRPSLDSVVLMMDSLVCDSVKRNGASASFQRLTGWLIVTVAPPLAQGESAAIDVYYHRRAGIPNRGFFYYSRQDTNHYALSFSVAAPYDARYWFPCYDEPFDKAEQGCAINVTVPDTFSVCSNGLLDSVRTDTAAHRSTYFWTHRFPIATYLMVFAVSRWVKYVQQYHPGLPDSVIVWSYCSPKDTVWVHDNLRNLPDMIGFYTDTNRFGRYPFERYGQVYCTGFQYGGMENQTMTMLALGGVNDGTICHELSHMWWGDMVTCVDYRNIWLNEGFANYWQAQYAEHHNGHAIFLATMRGYASSYFSEDNNGHNRFPTYDPGIENVYAYGTIYCKGAWLQHMLRYVEQDTVFLEPGVFYRALRAYGDSFKYGGASSQDYQRIQEHYSGLDLNWFYNEWLYQAGYPQYRLAWSAESTGTTSQSALRSPRSARSLTPDPRPLLPEFRVIVNLSQNNGNNAPLVFHMPVQLKFRKTGLDTLVVLSVEASPQIDTFSLGFRPDSISFDPGKWILNKATVTGVEEQFIQHPDPELQIVGPGLVRDDAQLRCSTPEPARLTIHDVAGRQVAQFRLRSGTTRIAWNCSSLPAGVYILRLTAGTESASRKLLIAR